MHVDHTLWIPENGGHHLSSRWDRLCLLRSRFVWRNPLFRLLLGLWYVPEDPCYVDGHETTQKLLQITLKQRQILLWNGLTVALVVRSQQTRHPSRVDSFLMPKISCRIWPMWSFEMPTVSAISPTFNRRSVNTSLWIFVALSSVVAVFGHLGVAYQKPTCDHVETS